MRFIYLKRMGFVETLRWRGMIQDIMPGTEELLKKEKVAAYVGIDPTADSLHIGHLVSIMLLKHLQLHGHKPLIVMGGATSMIGDPSFKSDERKLLTRETIEYNSSCIKKQFSLFLDFDSSDNAAELLNNYDWTKDYTFLNFIRDIGKHISVNYMMAKDSVKKRLETGISFTEFSYQLLQAFDYLHLYQHKNCRLQMGGSDQWGNITTGTELIRRVCGGEAYALTCPLITKSDGGKFGKTESGNIWLDSQKTSAYAFYQFWLNCSDEDAKKFIRIFTLLPQEEIIQLEKEHEQASHLRILQKTIATELTICVHSLDTYNKVLEATEILFGKSTADALANLSEEMFLSVFEGVPTFNVARSAIENTINIVDLLVEKANVFSSKGELRRLIKEGGLFVNKNKVLEEILVNQDYLLNNKYILIQKGKKNYYVIIVS